MKKTLTLTTLALLGGAVSVYSQGQIGIGDGLDSSGSFGIQIFTGAQATHPVAVSYGGHSGTELMGNSGDAPTAGQSYNTSPGSATYGAGTALGAGYSVQLLAGTSVGTLAPVGTAVTTWYTGSQTTAFGGYYKITPANGVVTIPGVAVGGTATVELAAWNNEGGTVLSLAAAQLAGDPWGVSMSATTAPLGGGIATPPFLPASIESFSLISAAPEPSTIALGVIGASTLLFRRRK
jgi:hypothetical protein